MKKGQEELELKNFVICDRAFFSQDNKLNIIGIFDRLFTAKLPGVHPLMFIAGSLKGPRGKEITIKLKAITPTKSLADKDIETKLSDSSGEANFVVEIPMLTLEAEGKYSFEAFYNEKSLGETAVELVLIKKGELHGTEENAPAN